MKNNTKKEKIIILNKYTNASQTIINKQKNKCILINTIQKATHIHQQRFIPYGRNITTHNSFPNAYDKNVSRIYL